MVRPRSLVIILAAIALAATGPVARTQENPPAMTGPARPDSPSVASDAAALPDAAAALPIEQRPYRIRAWVAVAPGTRLDAEGRARLIDAWLTLVQRFVGAPWDLHVAPDPGPLRGTEPGAITPEALTPVAEGWDKLWLIRIEPDGDGGAVLAGRSHDVLTGRLGPVVRVDAPHPRDLARPLFRLALTLFTPTAEIGPEADGGVNITIQGAALPAHDPVGAVAVPGTLFVPVRIFQEPDGSTRLVAPIGWTYLRVEELDGSAARCAVVSSLSNPLSRRIVGRHRLVAVGVKPAPVPTPFRFETLGPGDGRPAAGYTLTWRPGPEIAPRTVGTTGRDGRLVLPPGFADGLVTLRLLAGGIEPLAEFPALPGETTEERVIRVNPLPQAVALEARLDALRDEVVDLVATRARLAALLEARVTGEVWDDVKALLDQYRALPPKRTLLDRLEALRADARRQQEEQKMPVLTRTAQARLADTESLILRYLDDEPFEAYEDAYRSAIEAAAPAKTSG